MFSSIITNLKGVTELAAIEEVFSSGTTHTVSFDELVLSGDAAIKVRIGETGTNRTSCMQNIQSTVTPVTATAVQKEDYYPFGLTFNHWNSTTPENQYKYNGFEKQVEMAISVCLTI